MWLTELKRKGMVGTRLFGQSEFSELMLTRFISSAPILSWSSVSFSVPSALLLKTLILYLPPLRWASSSLMCLTAATVG
mgnify:CR=1 FL=1